MSIHIRHRRRRQIFPLPLFDANCELELFQSRIRARKRPALRQGVFLGDWAKLEQLAQVHCVRLDRRSGVLTPLGPTLCRRYDNTTFRDESGYFSLAVDHAAMDQIRQIEVVLTRSQRQRIDVNLERQRYLASTGNSSGSFDRGSLDCLTRHDAITFLVS